MPDPSPADEGPRVVASDPPSGGAAIYPFELYRKGVATLRRKRAEVTFSEAMDTSIGTVPLEGPGGEARSIPAQWSADERTLSLEIGPLDPTDGGSLPLEYESSYALDLGALRSRAGAPLAQDQPGLEKGRLAFTTAAQHGLLEHACGHTFDDPYAYVIATGAPEGAPAVGITHKRYVIQLPEAGATPAGHVSQKIPLAGATELFEYTLFLSADVSAEAEDVASGESVAVSVREAPPVCELIRHTRTAVLTEGKDYLWRFELPGASTFDVIFERDVVVQ